jgi:hypothetical protein
LDIYHSLSSDTLVTFTYLQDVGLSPTQTALSVLAVVSGFMIYYLVPFTFFFLYLAAFFDIFILLVVAMVAGMTLLGTMYVAGFLLMLLFFFTFYRSDFQCASVSCEADYQLNHVGQGQTLPPFPRAEEQQRTRQTKLNHCSDLFRLHCVYYLHWNTVHAPGLRYQSTRKGMSVSFSSFVHRCLILLAPHNLE